MMPAKLDFNSPQCQFFVVRKKRLCRMTVRPGHSYCGEHQPQPTTDCDQDETRIPCPNDPKHSCYARKLSKHLSICNARQQDTPVYIQHNINAPLETEPFKQPLSKTPVIEIKKLIDKVNLLYEKYLKDKIEVLPEREIHPAVMKEWQTEGRAESSLRHLRQASRLMYVMEDEGLVNDSTCYVELGAGKGQLSYFAWQAWCSPATGSSVLLVERAALRHKRDSKMRGVRGAPDRPPSGVRDTAAERTQEGPGLFNDEIDSNESLNETDTNLNHKRTIHNDNHSVNKESSPQEVNPPNDASSEMSYRVRADLAHLVLRAVPAVRARRAAVGLAKHLCGVATDYSLRCLTAGGALPAAGGALIATCCHHRCQRNGYVASGQLLELGIDSDDFNIILGVVSWATCGDGRSRGRKAESRPKSDDAPNGQEAGLGTRDLGLSREQREEVGRRAKALLDWGRVLYLKECGFDARLAYYVPNTVSLENLCIIAKKKV